ncbi:aldose 1-epimerase [Tamlana sp. I1]|uniref:aldose 1-epimerase n=1 Tax=Tamlana sp. I1 TaxID=2762061 RepID=UPI00188ED15A|nr:aldose 1-epimerase [Tamlana sp. I1]
MYQFNHNKETNILEVSYPESKSFAKIHLNQGASIQELTLMGQTLIKDLAPLTYAYTYASAFLFPFANRVKDGAYSYNEKPYQLEVNNKPENNALHGLIFDKKFKLLGTYAKEETAVAIFEYDEVKKHEGFPFTYTILLHYIFHKNSLDIEFNIKNTSSGTFPFTVGWHPYFLSANLFNSTLNFGSSKKLIIGERNIATGIEDIKPVKDLQIEDKQLDDCWVLNNDKTIKFTTPEYELIIDSSEENSFVQAYTPPVKNVIAIEPTTGVSDSFNNKIGIKELRSYKTYEIRWTIEVNKIKNN